MVSECVSKLIIPQTRDPKNLEKRGWDDRYLFVDLATAEEAERAVKELNGRQSWGVKIRVNKARESSWKPGERLAWEVDQQMPFPEAQS